MGHRFLEIAGSDAAHALQAASGSRAAYARMEGGAPTHDRLGEEEADFIAARDTAVLATVSASGWPYVQHRGGPPGFLKVLDDATLGFADYRGNRQYLSVANTQGDDRVALLLIDFAARRRLKLLGRAEHVDLARDPQLAARLVDPGSKATVERGWRIRVEAFDWNCPQHITPRFTVAEIEAMMAPLQADLGRLRAENADLLSRLTALGAPAP